ncbi:MULTISPECIES: lipoprotein insertase outer membrane protein LolB [Oleiagrimonas]|uniref:Outer-membrane lipoprotein LolB n=1 Tax=Oleiagrimonas citrea TaxID=1665687 RepID=A0A846ZQ82_9GAMM|nr:lipoprotein insertase outer membrane protein LolB [Oleiagrimonas sp. MCCC 1A03011]NKZ39740.1 outer membrane lipoprotein LolB [Oleiagrimonas citrea]RAP59308.1 outer membrane lipoprotein LolB [Oleiagrimonas sp. MCCC 1A03011]
MNIRHLLLGAAILALAACAPVRIKGDHAMLGAQQAREAKLSARNHWTIQARLAVTDGKHGGSGSLTWTQNGDRYDFTLRAPVTGRSFRLRGGPDGAELDGLDQGTLYGVDAEHLLARALGWRVPLQQLRYWVKGLRAPGGKAKLRFGENHLPSLLQQNGWNVEYRDWFAGSDPSVPRKVFASMGNYRVRVSIQRWSWFKR